jgi:hypothetical protein
MTKRRRTVVFKPIHLLYIRVQERVQVAIRFDQVVDGHACRLVVKVQSASVYISNKKKQRWILMIVLWEAIEKTEAEMRENTT